MGTKKRLAPLVRDIALDERRRGRVLDLFSGMGSVARSLSDVASVCTNDALEFTAAFARARLLDNPRVPVSSVVAGLQQPFNHRRKQLSNAHQDRLGAEDRALAGSRRALEVHLSRARHAANSDVVRDGLRRADGRSDAGRYCLATGYFADGYFSLRQAIELDALRYAIDTTEALTAYRDWLLSAWLASAGAVLNAPGHTAQFLKPNTDQQARRIQRNWRRSIWTIFADRLADVSLVGTKSWRASNNVITRDALEVANGSVPSDIGVVYADPPYTRDQYSRYYHVYETLYRYDFPTASGQGRTPTGRFTTAFSKKSQVRRAFDELVGGIARWRVPLILSYPSDGLLQRAGYTVESILERHLTIAKTLVLPYDHSTMGGSSGVGTTLAQERIYVCVPR